MKKYKLKNCFKDMLMCEINFVLEFLVYFYFSQT